MRANKLGGITCVGPSFHSPAGANAVTLATRSGCRDATSSAIHPPSELPAT